ncbi:hypothetical protein ElyMa_000515300 [Elysia marginata]|uniref:Uncharacterized protein n=1 Tax=Elysia marginata TaxID=1093978 RepID=A0AAV4FWW7_9GAST|nr:hypothetical protein ElyMa_000515300 [Elysia marginata]
MDIRCFLRNLGICCRKVWRLSMSQQFLVFSVAGVMGVLPGGQKVTLFYGGGENLQHHDALISPVYSITMPLYHLSTAPPCPYITCLQHHHALISPVYSTTMP